ncbi:MAG TPA: alpha-L-rhamnosidase C-terminal domain-containing protein, partial [Roseiflexaceae bacterium]|nr:alpha-L-rhamnosidase C-terminal domain-containing protein [Roseiflexaceae bacterium]
DESWETSHRFMTGYLAVGSGQFGDPAVPPASWRLPVTPLEPVALEREDGVLRADFGRETFGYIQLHDVAGHGRVRVQYGECAQEANDGEHCETYDLLDVAGADLITIDHSRALRYVTVIPEPQVQIGHVSLLYEALPLAYRGRFRCSNERVDQIFDLSLYTLHLNTREFFLDGIKRDRWLWSGDAYQSYLMNYYSFFDIPVTRRTIVALRGKDPVEEHLNTILDYSMYWFMGLYDYYQYTGDLAFVRKLYPAALRLMEFCAGRANADGLLEGQPGDWVFVDWARMPKEGELTFEQMVYCLSLEAIVRFAELFDDADTVARYRPLAEHVRRTIREVFWDAERGVFVHRRVDGVIDPLVTRHPAMFALLYDFVEPDDRRRLAETVMTNPDVPAITTPYMRFYELAALCEIGQHAHVLEEVLAYWGGMLALGATSFWEEYDPRIPIPEQYAMYGRPYGKSLCHAWGASPIYLFGKYFLGVTPAAPGYTATLIEPHLGGLEWIEGAVPTPDGEVTVFADATTLRVSIPAGTATVRFASSVPPEVSAGTLRETQAGHYELAIDQPGQVYQVQYAG